MTQAHILLLGGTGVSGIVFIKHYLTLPVATRPFLTLYVRSAGKLSAALTISSPPEKVRIITGSLDSSADFAKALKPAGEFPKVTSAISVLGAYIELIPFLTRFFITPTTPISDAFESTIMPQLRSHGVKRIFSLSTHTAISSENERKTMGWKPYLTSFAPIIIVPRGNAEMKGIAKHTIEGAGDGLEWTVFRVPILTEEGDKGVVAGELDAAYPWTGTLSREGQAKWLLKEIEERKWVGKTPMLNDVAR